MGNQKRITKTSLETLSSFLNVSLEGECAFYLAKSDWSTGKGRYTRMKALPVFNSFYVFLFNFQKIFNIF